MPWPLSQDYNEAVQNPAQSFADAELRQGEAETNALGLPAPRSGNFADVYAVVTGQRKWAVKCFTRQIPGLQERYQQISLHLEQVKLPFMVDFTFLERGIRVRGDWYPILKMQWVEGFTLNQFVKNSLDKPQVLDLLCQLWVKLAARLREANIAHCDLQHGNVLLVPGSKAGALQVKLVDYDGMCVPSLTLLKSIEVGHPAYQHPQRQREGIYSLEVDRFSHLVIYTALRALMAGGKALWDKHDDGDNLLFKPSDYQAPTNSLLYREILKSPIQEVRKLVQVLMQALSKPLDEVPRLDSLITTTAVSVLPARPTSEMNVKSLTRSAKESIQVEQPHAAFAKAAGADLVLGPKARKRVERKKSVLVPVLLVLAGLGLSAGVLFFAIRALLKPGATAVLAEAKPAKKLESKAAAARDPSLPGPYLQIKPKTEPELRPVNGPESKKDPEPATPPANTATGPVELNIIARIDGVDDVIITRERAQWLHQSDACAEDVKVNGFEWNLHAIFPNAGKTRYLPAEVDFSSATLEKRRGRDEVKLLVQEKDLLVVRFNDTSTASDQYEVRIKIDSTLSLTVIATIDGLDDLRISTQQLEWVHHTYDWPTDVSVNGMAWAGVQPPVLSNTGKTRYLPEDVDFTTARVTVKQGRESVTLVSKEENRLVLRFDDRNSEGSEVYDVVITMDRNVPARTPKAPPGAAPAAPGPR